MYTVVAAKDQAHPVNCTYSLTRNNNTKIIYKTRSVHSPHRHTHKKKQFETVSYRQHKPGN